MLLAEIELYVHEPLLEQESSLFRVWGSIKIANNNTHMYVVFIDVTLCDLASSKWWKALSGKTHDISFIPGYFHYFSVHSRSKTRKQDIF